MNAALNCPNLLAAVKDNPAAMAELNALLQLVVQLQHQVVELQVKVAGLEAQLRTNSRTSSKPPSSDRHNPGKPRPKSLRRSTGRKPGGQPGHAGSSLSMTDQPDEIVEHAPPADCPQCGSPLVDAPTASVERRQVIELEKPRRKVLEHRGKSVRCPQCGVVVEAAFPPGVTAPVQYGASVQAAVVYLHAAQLVPSQRTAQIMADLCACALSPGSVSTMVHRAGAGAQQVTCEIKQRLLQEPWVSFDETGLSLSGKNHWLHTASSPLWTLLHGHEKRGEEGIAAGGVLPNYTGKAIHDFLPAYLRFEQCSHGLCNAHHLRDLTFVHEVLGQSWAQQMIEYLTQAKKLSDKRRGQGRKLSARELEQMQDRYVKIMELAYEQNPEPPPKQPGQRGRPARGKALNLADRFAVHDQKVMAFLLDEDTPFDNNHAERDVRMMKVRQKISGCFRSEETLHAFACVRSVMSTAAKNAVGVFHAIKVLFAPQPSLELVLANEASGT